MDFRIRLVTFVDSLLLVFRAFRHRYKNLPTYPKKLVLNRGFYWSGSGTIKDYLSEFSNTSTFGVNNDEAGEITKRAFSEEFFLVRNTIVPLLADCRNVFKSLYYIRKMQGYSICYKDYLDAYYNNYYRFIRKYVLNLPIMTRKRGVKIAGEFIQDFFSQIESKEYLFFDQMLSFDGLTMEEKFAICGDFKYICVYRDPRDQYISIQNVERNQMLQWWPEYPRNAVDFVKLFKTSILNSIESSKSKNTLLLRFEDIVLNYDETFKKLNDFIGISEENHIYKKQGFIPENSKRNIGLYKTWHNQDEIKYIEEHLADYLYRG